MGSTMTAVVAETVDGARARIVVDGYPVEFVAETIHEAVYQVQRRAVALARERQAPVQLKAEDPQSVHYLIVSPEGQIVADPDKGEQRPARRRPGFLRRSEPTPEPADAQAGPAAPAPAPFVDPFAVAGPRTDDADRGPDTPARESAPDGRADAGDEPRTAPLAGRADAPVRHDDPAPAPEGSPSADSAGADAPARHDVEAAPEPEPEPEPDAPSGAGTAGSEATPESGTASEDAPDVPTDTPEAPGHAAQAAAPGDAPSSRQAAEAGGETGPSAETPADPEDPTADEPTPATPRDDATSPDAEVAEVWAAGPLTDVAAGMAAPADRVAGPGTAAPRALGTLAGQPQTQSQSQEASPADAPPVPRPLDAAPQPSATGARPSVGGSSAAAPEPRSAPQPSRAPLDVTAQAPTAPPSPPAPQTFAAPPSPPAPQPPASDQGDPSRRQRASGGLRQRRAAAEEAAAAGTGAHWGEGAPSTFLPAPSLPAPPPAPPAKKSLFGSIGGLGSRPAPADQAPAEPMTFGAPQAPALTDAQLLRRRHPKPATIAVVNPKGGAGKTPLTLLLAAAFAEHTNGVLAWDNNPFRGTLGWRVESAEHGGTVGTLLADLDRLRGRELRLSDIDAYVHPQEDGVDVLPGDPMAIETGTVGGVQVEQLWSHLSRYYRVLVMDSGNDERSPGWQSMIARADQIVVISSTRYEVAESARLMLDALSRGDDHARHLARSAVAVVSQAHPDEDIERDPSLATARQIADGFAYLARASVVVPYDPAVASIRLRWQSLAPGTRAAVTRAAALVASGLPAQ